MEVSYSTILRHGFGYCGRAAREGRILCDGPSYRAVLAFNRSVKTALRKEGR